MRILYSYWCLFMYLITCIFYYTRLLAQRQLQRKISYQYLEGRHPCAT